MKRVFCIIVSLVMTLTLVSCNNNKTEDLADSDIERFIGVGISNGNVHNGGYVAYKDGWFYYSDKDDNGNLCKQKVDGGDYQKLSDGHFSYGINVIGDWIFYLGGSPGKVYRVRQDGTNETVIVDKMVGNLIVSEKGIFYRLSYDNDWGKLYYSDFNGKNEVLLSDSVAEFAIDGEWLFYSNSKDSNSLYKMKTDGSNITKLNGEYSANINVWDGKIYYTAYNDKRNLHSINIDGTNRNILSQDSCWNVNLHKGFIYYRNQSDNGKIYKMTVDGKENKTIIEEENCTDIIIVDDKMFFRIPVATKSGITGYFVLNLDGNNIEKIFPSS